MKGWAVALAAFAVVAFYPEPNGDTLALLACAGCLYYFGRENERDPWG